MAQKEYIVEGRSFRTESDYKRALRDRETIEKLRERSAEFGQKELEQLLAAVQSGKISFYTLLGQDYEDELADQIKQLRKKEASGGQRAERKREKTAGKQRRSGKKETSANVPQVSEQKVLEELKRQDRRRRWMIVLCMLVAAGCLGYFGVYLFFIQRTDSHYENLKVLKDKETIATSPKQPAAPVIHYTDDGEQEIPEVLEEYKNLLIKNKKLIGWIKIDDTNIDYPVMQTSDNEYYLDHNMNQEYDKNGSIFMDKDCDAIKPSMNLILYGHHMQSGKMFGNLGKYSDQKYYEKHKYIKFDTIYEKGVYEVMYVFRSRVYSEGDVVFKYYQFIDAMSEVEFDSYMKEMADISLYDTGVSASYGDHLLTLSTCDYQEKNGRFVVVAKKISQKE